MRKPNGLGDRSGFTFIFSTTEQNQNMGSPRRVARDVLAAKSIIEESRM